MNFAGGGFEPGTFGLSGTRVRRANTARLSPTFATTRVSPSRATTTAVHPLSR